MKLPELSPQTIIESQIGFYSGILLGAIASAVMVIWFVPMAWYFKLTSVIGSVCIIGVLVMSLYQLIIQRRQYLEMQKMMKVQNDAAVKTLADGGVAYVQ